MVRLRGMPRPGPPGRGMGRPMPRYMRPDAILPPFGMPRGRFVRGHPVRPGPPRLPPRMAPPPPPGLGLPPPPLPPRRLPLPPHPPLPPRDLPPPMGRRPLPPPPLARRPGMRSGMPPPPHVVPMLPPMPPHLRRPIRPGPLFVRGRGGVARRGVKRLGATTNGRAKKPQKRKEKTEEMEQSKPWVTEALKVEIHKKYQLYEVAKEKKTDVDWQAYKDQRILVGQMTNTAKLEYVGSHPDAGEFFCESCDRGFKTQELLDAHIAEHQVCGRDGCMFAAHPKIVEKHIQLQHDTGLYHRIVFTQNPDEVAKWIAERKSRYPTKENVERKDAQTSEMIQRGERIPTHGKPFHNKERKGSWQDRKRKQNHNTTNFDRHQKQMTKQNPNTKSDETKWKDPEAWRGNLPKFPGTAAFPLVTDEPQIDDEDDKRFSDEDSVSNSEQAIEQVTKPLVSNVLASLMINYGSDTDDDDNDMVYQTPEAEAISLQSKVVCSAKPREQGVFAKTEETNIQIGETEVRKQEDEVRKQEDEEYSDGAPEECGIHREDSTKEPVPKPYKEDLKPQENKPVEPKTQEAARPTRPKPPVKPPMKRYQLSLLEKLLQNEIRQERNAILQCVRYVVRNNFFGCGSNN